MFILNYINVVTLQMGKYFTAYRIDHILGFFRIWELPDHAMTGLCGKFRPSIPISQVSNTLLMRKLHTILRILVLNALTSFLAGRARVRRIMGLQPSDPALYWTRAFTGTEFHNPACLLSL